jgi:hypothetical protein
VAEPDTAGGAGASEVKSWTSSAAGATSSIRSRGGAGTGGGSARRAHFSSAATSSGTALISPAATDDGTTCETPTSAWGEIGCGKRPTQSTTSGSTRGTATTAGRSGARPPRRFFLRRPPSSCAMPGGDAGCPGGGPIGSDLRMTTWRGAATGRGGGDF